MRPTTRLRQLVSRPDLAFLMEAHDGLSARIVEEAGFEGIWASGLTMSATFGVRDNNELSWTQVVYHVASWPPSSSWMGHGYGNPNSMRRLAAKPEQVGSPGWRSGKPSKTTPSCGEAQASRHR
jgi:phosphoenolpyruvate phosphomutase